MNNTGHLPGLRVSLCVHTCSSNMSCILTVAFAFNSPSRPPPPTPPTQLSPSSTFGISPSSPSSSYPSSSSPSSSCFERSGLRGRGREGFGNIWTDVKYRLSVHLFGAIRIRTKVQIFSGQNGAFTLPRGSLATRWDGSERSGLPGGCGEGGGEEEGGLSQ